MKYTTTMIWNLASFRGEGHCYMVQLVLEYKNIWRSEKDVKNI